MNIFIVILHFGKLETTQMCVNSLATHDSNFAQIVLVNNDENITLSHKEFSVTKNKLHIINNAKNIGFAAGVNQGIKYALEEKAEYVFLLNNDTIIDEKFFKKLTGVFQKNKKIGIVGPAIMFHKNNKTIYDLGGSVNRFFCRTSHEEVETITWDRSYSKIVTYISGCCMLIKREVFENIGYFDEHFFLYYEDADFCLRARKAGFLSAILPSVHIYHELSKAAGNLSAFSVYHQTRSGVIFGKKYCKMHVLNISFLIAQSVLIFSKHRKAGIGALRGLWDGLML